MKPKSARYINLSVVQLTKQYQPENAVKQNQQNLPRLWNRYRTIAREFFTDLKLTFKLFRWSRFIKDSCFKNNFIVFVGSHLWSAFGDDDDNIYVSGYEYVQLFFGRYGLKVFKTQVGISQSWARDNTAATTWPGFRAKKLLIMALRLYSLWLLHLDTRH